MAQLLGFILLCTLSVGAAGQQHMSLIDTHIHYSHDAWEIVAPERAVSILRKAGLRKAFVSSSSDEGTQALYRVAPDLVIPVLRPYRRRGDLHRWMYDDTVVPMLEDRLQKYRYAGIGEFHASENDIDLPVLKQVIELAKRHGLFLHIHANANAIDKVFAQNSEARVLWAHGGFESPDIIYSKLKQYQNLWCDLSFRPEVAYEDSVDKEWRKLFLGFPDRFTIGADTYTPERWFYVEEYAGEVRSWLTDLPDYVAKNIAYRNAEELMKNFYEN